MLTYYAGLGLGMTFMNRSIESIVDKVNNYSLSDDKKGSEGIEYRGEKYVTSKPQAKFAYGGSGTGILGLSYQFHPKVYTGLEGYFGYQYTKSDYYQTSFFGGGYAFLGFNLTNKLSCAAGFGLDIAKQISKKIDAQSQVEGTNNPIIPLYTVQQSKDIGYIHLAGTINVIVTQQINANWNIKLSYQWLIPKSSLTPAFDYAVNEPKEKVNLGDNDIKINYALSQHRVMFSVCRSF